MRVKAPSFIGSKLDKTKCKANQPPLINETPFLLHPEIDTNPEIYLSFKISDKKEGIEIIGIDDQGRGTKTIEICNLNRPTLKLNRLEAVYYHFKQLIDIVFDWVAKETNAISDITIGLKYVFEKIEFESENEDLTHTLLRKFVISDIKNFEHHFAPYLDSDEQRMIVIKAFQNYKSGTL